MKKQIVSLILALILSFGYTCQILAVNDGSFGTATSPEAVLKEDKFANSVTSDEKFQEAYKDTTLQYLIGQITSVYTFLDGKLTTITNADKTVDVFFNGKKKGTVKKYDDEGGDYEWVNINLDETDVQAFDNFKKTNPRANFGDYLIAAFGVTETVAARVTNLQNNTSTLEEFLRAGFETGFSAEVSISLGEVPTDVKATFSSPAGKRLKTLDFQGNTTEEWFYGNNSSLPTKYVKFGESGEEIPFTVTEYSDGTDRYKDDRGNTIPAGQPAWTWETSISSTTLSSKGVEASIASVEEKDKKRTTIYTYDAKTNQRLSETDLSTGEITTYEHGRPVAVYYKAEEGSAPRLKRKIVYGNNGLVQSVIDYNNTEDNEQTQISVYADDGRFLGSSEGKDVDEVTLRKALRELDNLFGRQETTADQIVEFFENHPTITSFNFSYAYLERNEALVEAVFMMKDVEFASSTGTVYSSPMIDAFRERRAANPDETILASIQALADEEAKDGDLEPSERVWQSALLAYDSLRKLRSDFTVSTAVLREERPDLDTNVTTTTTTSPVEGSTNTYNETTTRSYDRTTVTSVEFTINVKIDESNTISYTNKYASSAETKRQTDPPQIEERPYDPAGVKGHSLAGGTDGNEIDAETAQARMAAAAAGEPGEPVYIKLATDSVNMLDGAGFKDITTPRKGEEIFIKIEDQDMFNAFKGAVGTDAQEMVIGVVTNDIDGKMCLQVYHKQNENGSDIGFGLESTTSDKDIGDKLDAMKTEIETLAQQEGSWVSKNTQTSQKIFQAAGVTNSQGYLDDWKTGWNELAKLAGGGK